MKGLPAIDDSKKKKKKKGKKEKQEEEVQIEDDDSEDDHNLYNIYMNLNAFDIKSIEKELA